MLETTLLQHYFLLTIRKAINESISSFWEEMDTYTTYQLLEWVNEVIEVEDDMRNNPDKYKNKSSKPRVEESEQALELYYEMTGRGPEYE